MMLMGRPPQISDFLVIPLQYQGNSVRHKSWVVYRTTADNYFAPKTGYNAPNSTRFGGGKAMVSHLLYYQLALLALIWLFIMLHLSWPRPSEPPPPVPATPIKPKRKRSPEPKAFEGLTHKPPCALHCTSCAGYFPEHHGTIFHGKQAAVELIVRVLAC